MKTFFHCFFVSFSSEQLNAIHRKNQKYVDKQEILTAQRDQFGQSLGRVRQARRLSISESLTILFSIATSIKVI